MSRRRAGAPSVLETRLLERFGCRTSSLPEMDEGPQVVVPALSLAQGGEPVRLSAADWTGPENRLRALGMAVADGHLRDPWGNRLRLEVSVT